MRGAEGIVRALLAAGEPGQAAALAQGAHALAPPGQDLVRIGLVAHVPDQLVARGVKDGVKRHRKLDHAEPGAEVAAGTRNDVDHVGAQLVGQAAQVFLFQLSDVRRRTHLVE